jgi:hypothetical protein
MAMAQPRAKPLFDPATSIEDDLYLWCHEQAELLRQHRFNEADLPNIIEELESMGRSDRFRLLSNYTVLLAHLLKWRHQPQRRSVSWELTIAEHRRRITKQLDMSPSLASRASDLIGEAYPDARRQAAIETRLPPADFSAQCPFTLEQIRDIDWLPE